MQKFVGTITKELSNLLSASPGRRAENRPTTPNGVKDFPCIPEEFRLHCDMDIFRSADYARTKMCTACGTFQGVQLEPSRTAYHFEGEIGSPEDPNKPMALCRSCAKEYHEYWDEMWAEYYSGRL